MDHKQGERIHQVILKQPKLEERWYGYPVGSNKRDHCRETLETREALIRIQR